MTEDKRKRMDWARLMASERFGQEESAAEQPGRTDYQRDYDRLIFSAPFRRLQNKTQVFPLPGQIFVHNRLTHTLEVSCVGRSLGNAIGRAVKAEEPELPFDFSDVGTVVSAACLAHDMGNPPFGHAGERAIHAYFTEGAGTRWRESLEAEGGRWTDFVHYDGNANGLRLLTHTFCGRRPGGYGLTYATIGSFIKYPYTSAKECETGKFGCFASEEETLHRVARKLGLPALSEEGEHPEYARHPLVYLVEAADDICYQIMDLEDAYKLKILSQEECTELLYPFLTDTEREEAGRVISRLSDDNEQIAYLRGKVVNRLTLSAIDTFLDHREEILSGTFHGSLIGAMEERQREAYREAREVAFDRIYYAGEVLDIELAGFRIFSSLLDNLIEAQRHPEKAYSKLWFNRIPSQYDMSSLTLYGKIQSALDYISGMTDVYALDLYRKFTGMSLPAI